VLTSNQIIISMRKYKFEYTIQSTVSNTVIIEAEDEFKANEKFDCMAEDLIAENYEDIKHTSNIRVCDDPYMEEID
ncbi:MAG: hypothetical protein II453_13230, partial [Alphaproteobacteria bacterium]|nr:hypothetical protein [Alphaproteobacteria bacterium]